MLNFMINFYMKSVITMHIIIIQIYVQRGGQKLVNTAHTKNICSAILFREAGKVLSNMW